MCIGRRMGRGWLYRCVVCFWAWTVAHIVSKTSASYLVLIAVEHQPDRPIYEVSQASRSTQRNFLAGPGEGVPFQRVHLHFEGVIRIQGSVLRYVHLSIEVAWWRGTDGT